jgi:aspartate/methionine/tyrosine aminotransferase
LADYSALSDEPDDVFARRLAIEARVAAIPIGVFYERNPAPNDLRVVRLCFAKRDDTLHEGLRRLRDFAARCVNR